MGKSNVNKDHYIGSHGRERQGEEIVQRIHRQQLEENKRRVENKTENEAPNEEEK